MQKILKATRGEKMRNTKIMKFSEKKLKSTLFIIGMLFFPILNFFVFYVYVNFNSILMAFQVNVGNATKWGLDNFSTMFTEFSLSGGVLGIALKNTFFYFFTSLLITLPLSFFLSYFLYKKIAFYRVFRVIFYLPNIISASVLVALFKYFIGTNGPVAYIGEKLGLGTLPPLLMMSETATKVIVFYCIFFGLGANLILFSGAMSNIDSGIVEAGKIDGAGIFTEMFRLVVPLIWPTLSTIIIFQFIGIFNASGPILLFGGGQYDTWTISYWIYDKVTFGNTLNYPAAVGLFFSAVGAPIALLARWALTRFYDYE